MGSPLGYLWRVGQTSVRPVTRRRRFEPACADTSTAARAGAGPARPVVDPGRRGAADELEVVPGELLRARKATFPCEGTEIVITMEDAETGTRLTFVQNGFGDGFAEQRPWLEAGWWSIRADLFVFFDRGLAVEPGL